MNKSIVHFTIFPADDDHINVTEVVGIRPSKQWTKGESYVGKYYDPEDNQVKEELKIRSMNMWELSSDEHVEATLDMNVHIGYILGILESKSASFLAIKDRIGCRMQIGFWCEGEGAFSYSLTSEQLSRCLTYCHDLRFTFIGIDDENQQ